MSKVDLHLLYFTASERKASILLDVLKQRYRSVCLVHDHNEWIIFRIENDSGSFRHQFKVPLLPKYLRILYQWTGMALFILRQAFKKRFDLAVCEGVPLLLICLKPFLVYKRLVYYAHDWFPNQPLVHRYDRLASQVGDVTWNLAKEISEARDKRWGIHTPEPIVIDSIYGPRPDHKRTVDPVHPSLCYVGYVRPQAGLDLAIRALGILKEQNIHPIFHIVGRSLSPQLSRDLENLTASLGLQAQVKFHGFIQTTEMIRILETCNCAISILPGGDQNYSNYTVVGKVREYFEGGIPVIISKSSAMAKDIVESRAGLTVEDSPAEIAKAIVFFCAHPENASEFNRNAYAFACKRSSPEKLWKAIESAAL